MKNKIFIYVLVFVAVVLFAIGGGCYIYSLESRVPQNTIEQQTSSQNSTNTTSQSISIESVYLGSSSSAYSSIIYVNYLTKYISTTTLVAYLYNPVYGNVVMFPKFNLGDENWGTTRGELSLNLGDQTKAGVTILPGQYQVFLCDRDIKDIASPEKILCGSSQPLSITSINIH